MYKKEQKDYGNRNFQIENTEYLINTANPINWIKSSRKIKKLHPNMIIFQWWHPYFAPCYWMMCKCLKKYKKLFICHNVFPHERFPMDRLLTRNVLRQGNRYIVQSTMDAEDLKTIIKNPIYRQTVHPTYNAFRIQNLSKEDARNELQIRKEEKVLLFFGFIREYKGLKYLIEAMYSVTKQLEDVRLLIVGDFANAEEKKEYQEMIQKRKVEQYVDIYDGYIPDQEVEKFFASCDLVVLPYISATQSGIVQIAYGFDKPVIVTNVGGLPDVVENGKTGYVVETNNTEKLSDAIISFYKEKKEDEFVENVKKEAYRFDWERMVELIENLFEDWK